ncbi:hypothetical protein QE152_g22760 [Popillia japonica]|uniref:Uncharacterized protein n=1 Tax=Popillia japonica TaxID=7064 RepID=A0AAW1KJA0_POPJA
MGLPQLKLKQDVVACWNSTYDMLARIFKMKDAVVSTLAILSHEQVNILTPTDWTIVEKRHSNIDSTVLPELREMIQILTAQLTTRFNTIEDNELIAQATLLDPRFKKYAFSDTNKTDKACASLSGSEQVSAATIQNASASTSSLWKNFDKKDLGHPQIQQRQE